MNKHPNHYLLEDWLAARRAQRLRNRARRSSPAHAEHLLKLADKPIVHRYVGVRGKPGGAA